MEEYGYFYQNDLSLEWNTKLLALKKLLCITLLSTFTLIPGLVFSQKHFKKQKKYLPPIVQAKKVYFGMPLSKFLKKFPAAERMKQDSYRFRKIYSVPIASQKVERLIAYVDSEGNNPVYEFLLVIKDHFNAGELAKELFGPPNYKEVEWRFRRPDTDLDFELAAWTFENKIIIASALPNSEWQDGFIDP